MGVAHLIASFLLSTVAVAAFSQDTIYIDKKNQWLDTKEGADHYVIRTPLGDKNIKVSIYTLADTLREVGHYSVFTADRKECIRDGLYTVYYPNGQTSRIINFKNDKRHGSYQKFYKDGKLKYTCQYVNAKQDGDLTMYYNDGTIWRTEKYANGKLQEGHVYDEKGKELKFYPSESMPEYPGGVTALMSDLARLIKYPKDAAKNKIEGKVLIRIVVNKEGYISDAKVLRGADPQLNAEALRVVGHELKKVQWKPGVQDGEIVRVSYVVPINFRIP